MTAPMTSSLLVTEEAASGTNVQSASVQRRASVLLGGIILASTASMAAAAVFSLYYPVVLGHATLAFVLGLRHAVDCDHLAAIDNVTRQLVARGQAPVSVGFWFAVGHSTIVVLLTAALAGGYSALNSGENIAREWLVLVAGVLAVGVLGGIGLLNARVAVGLMQDWASLRKRSPGSQSQVLEEAADASLRTALTTVPCLRRFFQRVNRAEKMFFVGVLFGLSFDTASQVGVIALAAVSSTNGSAPPALAMLFPLCFSCGMCLVDTANGLLMLLTYNWATVRPLQKIAYNLLVTAMSAGIALCIGTLELLQIIGREMGLSGPFWSWAQGVDMGTVGCSIMAAFFLVFAAALCSQTRCCGRVASSFSTLLEQKV